MKECKDTKHLRPSSFPLQACNSKYITSHDWTKKYKVFQQHANCTTILHLQDANNNSHSQKLSTKQ